MSLKSKTIYKTCVRPVMIYAGETRAETAATNNRNENTALSIDDTLSTRRRNDDIRR